MRLFETVLIIGLAVFIGEWFAKKLLVSKTTPVSNTTTIITKTSTGDPVRDFMDNY